MRILTILFHRSTNFGHHPCEGRRLACGVWNFILIFWSNTLFETSDKIKSWKNFYRTEVYWGLLNRLDRETYIGDKNLIQIQILFTQNIKITEMDPNQTNVWPEML